jgi:PTS hybrid protein
MAEESRNGLVSLVLVSHSAMIADGLADLLAQVAGPDVLIIAAGGGPDGSFGTDGGKVHDAMERAVGNAGAVVLMDLGSSVLSVRAAMAELPLDVADRLEVVDAPLVEGAIAAAVAASIGQDLEAVRGAAEEAWSVRKL